MAKSGKPNLRPQTPKPKTPAAPAQTARTPRQPAEGLSRPATDTAADPVLRKIFLGLAGAALLLLLGLALGSGVNADDKYQVDYSNKLVNYYGTFGRDTAALYFPKDNGSMHLYGGFFEIVTGFSNKALGFKDNDVAYHHVRHLWSAFFGWVAILCAALLARLIGGWRAGIITLVIMILSPRFVGDSLMNPKDIPFAAGYIMALYNLAAVLHRMPDPRRWNLAGLVAGLAIALATRAGGLLSFVLMIPFGGLYFLARNGGLKALANGKLLARYAVVLLGTALVGYVLALAFWPFALQKPLENVKFALDQFAALEVKIRVLYEGANVMSDKTPWHYAVKWILNTIPLAVLPAAVLAFACFLLFLPLSLVAMFAPRRLNYKAFWLILIGFSGIFPVAFVIYKNSTIHDGWRHLTFAYPPLAVVAGLFWNELANYFSAKKALQYATFGVMGLLLADSAYFIAANRQYPYVYFNPVAGGMKGAFGQFETDYWGVSTRQGIEWLEQQGILKPGMTDTVTIATNMHFSAKPFVSKYGDKVRLRYLKWDRRCDEPWDYALYPTRFIDGSTLRLGEWPPANTVHTVEANGVPLLAVLKNSQTACYDAVVAAKKGDWPAAIENYNKEVAAVPDNDLAWAGLAQAYLSIDSLELSKTAAEKALSINSDDAQANNTLAMYWLGKNDAIKAKSQFELAVKRDPANAVAWYYLAQFAREAGRNQEALNLLRNAITAAPTFKQAYQLSAEIYEAAGNPQAAQQFRGALQKLK